MSCPVPWLWNWHSHMTDSSYGICMPLDSGRGLSREEGYVQPPLNTRSLRHPRCAYHLTTRGDMCSCHPIYAPCGIFTAHIPRSTSMICAATPQYTLPAASPLRISHQGCRIHTESQPPISFGNIADNHLIFFCRLTKCQPFLFGMSFDLSGTVVLAEAAAPLPCCLPDSG